MGSRGPIEMPVELVRRLGDPGHRRIPKDVESAQLGESIEPIAPPETLGPAGAEMWMEVLPVLAKYGGLRSVDLPALSLMCQAWQRAKDAEEAINSQGMGEVGTAGQIVVHPMVRVEQQYMEKFLRFAEQFGLTWIARSRLGLSEATRSAVLAGLEGKIGANPRG